MKAILPDVLPKDCTIPGAWSGESAEHADRRGFSGTIGAEKTEHFTPFECKGEFVDRNRLSIALRKLPLTNLVKFLHSPDAIEQDGSCSSPEALDEAFAHFLFLLGQRSGLPELPFPFLRPVRATHFSEFVNPIPQRVNVRHPKQRPTHSRLLFVAGRVNNHHAGRY